MRGLTAAQHTQLSDGMAAGPGEAQDTAEHTQLSAGSAAGPGEGRRAAPASSLFQEGEENDDELLALLEASARPAAPADAPGAACPPPAVPPEGRAPLAAPSRNPAAAGGPPHSTAAAERPWQAMPGYERQAHPQLAQAPVPAAADRGPSSDLAQAPSQVACGTDPTMQRALAHEHAALNRGPPVSVVQAPALAAPQQGRGRGVDSGEPAEAAQAEHVSPECSPAGQSDGQIAPEQDSASMRLPARMGAAAGRPGLASEAMQDEQKGFVQGSRPPGRMAAAAGQSGADAGSAPEAERGMPASWKPGGPGAAGVSTQQGAPKVFYTPALALPGPESARPCGTPALSGLQQGLPQGPGSDQGLPGPASPGLSGAATLAGAQQGSPRGPGYDQGLHDAVSAALQKADAGAPPAESAAAVGGRVPEVPTLALPQKQYTASGPDILEILPGPADALGGIGLLEDALTGSDSDFEADADILGLDLRQMDPTLDPRLPGVAPDGAATASSTGLAAGGAAGPDVGDLLTGGPGVGGTEAQAPSDTGDLDLENPDPEAHPIPSDGAAGRPQPAYQAALERAMALERALVDGTACEVRI